MVAGEFLGCGQISAAWWLVWMEAGRREIQPVACHFMTCAAGPNPAERVDWRLQALP